MERRASSTDEIALLVAEHRPDGSCGFYIDFKSPSGLIMRRPTEGAWSFEPLTTPGDLFEGLLTVHYVDEEGHLLKAARAGERLVIDFTYDPSQRGIMRKSAVHSFSDFSDRVNKAEQVDPSDDDVSLEEIEGRQRLQVGEQKLLTVDTLQLFLRDTLGHFVRLQEAAAKGSQAQIEVTLSNLEKLTAHSTNLFDMHLAAAKTMKQQMAELEPSQAPQPMDLPGLFGTVLPFIRDMWHGPPGQRALEGRSSSRRLSGRASEEDEEEGDLLEAESEFNPSVADADEQADLADLLKELSDPGTLAMTLNDPREMARLAKRLDQARQKGRPERTRRQDKPGSKAASASSRSAVRAGGGGRSAGSVSAGNVLLSMPESLLEEQDERRQDRSEEGPSLQSLIRDLGSMSRRP